MLKGTWWVGTGTKYDPDSTVPMPAGTFVTHYGQQVHFDGAKDEDAVLLIVGEGPGTSTAGRGQVTSPTRQAADLAAGRMFCVSVLLRLARSRMSSIEATSMRLRPLSLAR